ncbi:gp85 [Synechococcus phage syn9]|uniref:Gp85 n=1 Tax=Synechococcus phage syn9 TaxID=382359 RepID=Q0QZE3_BPSYS|nr:gp85 [Synechococcus phage syn9]ABA47054.1 gp85 [Synechococcus phage syn9]
MVFQHGDVYHYQQYKGFINWVGKEYITLCIRQTLKEDRLQLDSKSKYVQVNVCIFPQNWDKLIKSNETLSDIFP